MSLGNKHIIYFLGIGGIGMSALARWFRYCDLFVAGYDKTKTPLTQQLAGEGIEIHFDDQINAIPQKVLDNKEEVLVIYTPAIPADHNELNYLRDQGFEIMKRSKVLGVITKNMFSVAVAGTHGKTTTSSMIAHLLKSSRKSCVGFLGGILQGYESNLIMEGDPGEDTIAVVEADEFDRSFLSLDPNISVITSADADHLDIYGDHASMKESFRLFAEKTAPKGHLFVNESLASWLVNSSENVHYHTYGLNAQGNKAENIRIEEGAFRFDFTSEKHVIENLKLMVPGYHNVENSVAAISVALELGVDTENIRKGIESYRGVKRRFEYIINTEKRVYIDDYAHHPTEIKAFLRSVKALYPEKKITAIFQPHLYSRTKDFVDGFAESLDLADDVILMNIYPARELPIPGVDSGLIFGKMKNDRKMICPDDELLELIDKKNPEVLVTVGAGDIDRFIQPVKSLLERKDG